MLIESGEFEIFDTYGSTGDLITKVFHSVHSGVVHHDKSQYIPYILENKMYHFLDYSWFSLLFEVDEIEEVKDVQKHTLQWIQQIFLGFKYAIVSPIQEEDTVTKVLVSGSGRTWLEILTTSAELTKQFTTFNEFYCKLFKSIYFKLAECSKDIFCIGEVKPLSDYFGVRTSLLNKEEVAKLGNLVTEYNDWFCVRFINVSSRFPLLLNNYRMLTCSSTNANLSRQAMLDLIFPEVALNMYCEQYSDKGRDILSSYLQTSYELYKSLVDSGISVDIASQILPLGTSSEVFVSGTLYYWKQFLQHITENPYNWELQKLVGLLVTELKNRKLV